MAYHPAEIEPQWQAFWEEQAVFKTHIDHHKPKYYVLDMFPYPSSSGLHVGHPEGYTATDIVARYKRARGFNVLHPMGWDAFGLPAEQYALQTGIHPAITTQKAIENFQRQLKSLGFSYDWSRTLSTCDPNYYRWTQFLFLKLHERGLAYQKEVPVNWCPELKTVLANEEVVEGRSERGGHPVFRIPMKQWMLKITAYAEKLLQGLEGLDWPESTKELQRNWIGRSSGLQLQFQCQGHEESLEVFTTRPDTLFGVTYLVLAPEHPWVSVLMHPHQKRHVDEYCRITSQKSEVSRQDVGGEKTGVFLGSFVLHPITKEPLPIWISDYVFMNYGTGAVMGVPAHDSRDFAFAKKFGLPIKPVIRRVIQPAGDPSSELLEAQDECFEDEGILTHSGAFTGLSTQDAQEAIIALAEKEKWGHRKVNYKLRDWLFSRQRYWGEPFPVAYLHTGEICPLPADELPVILPEVSSYEPSGTGESPLASMTDWLEIVDSRTGRQARRETDTMPGSAGSSWYFLRFCDPHNACAPFSQEAQKYWMPVDLYLGGPEHAVGHLLYARFWAHVLHDMGWLNCPEPFQKLVHQGMIQGEDGEKMSKSRGNVINPDHVIAQYGADTLRLYEMFMGPLDRDKPWSTTAIEGVYRFLNRVWRVYLGEGETSLLEDLDPTSEELKLIHKTIQKVTEDIENLRFNTAISQMMIFINAMTQQTRRPTACLVPFLKLLQPFAPHLAEELWKRVGEKDLLSYAAWPLFDPALVQDQTLTLAVQVSGKTRGTVEVAVGSTQAEVENKARQLPTVQQHLAGKSVVKIVFVQDKIFNFVIRT